MIVFLSVLHVANAQEIERQKPEQIFKLNLSSLLLKTGCIQYERGWKNRYSLTAAAIYRPKSTIGDFLPALGYTADNDPYRVVTLSPGIRYYFSKTKKMQGAYIEFNLRYKNDYAETIYFTQTPYPNSYYLTLVENMFLFGSHFGFQFFKQDKVVLDLWILGSGIGIDYIHATGIYDEQSMITGSTTDTRKATLETKFPETYKFKAEYKWTDDNFIATGTKFIYTPRGLGVTLGFRF